MSEEWYYGKGGQRGGPVDLATLQGMVRAGQIGAEDLVWRAGMPNWLPASTVPETASLVIRQPTGGTVVSGPTQAPNWNSPQQQPQQAAPQSYNPPQPNWGSSTPNYNQPNYNQPNYGQPQSMPYATPYANPENTKATTAMVLGILSVCTGCLIFLGPVALVMGINAKKFPGNQGQATAAIIMGAISSVILALFLLFFLVGIIAAASGH